MCSVSLAFMAISAVGTLMSAAGQQQAGQAAQGSAEFNAAVARNNAIAARDSAATEAAIEERNAAEIGLKARQLEGLQRTTLAGNLTRLDPDVLAIIDTQTANFNTSERVRNLLNQSQNFEAQAGLFETQGANAVIAANFESVGTILGGASSVATQWQAYKTVGAPT